MRIILSLRDPADPGRATRELPRFAALAAAPDEEVADFASRIVAELREEPTA